MNAATLLETIRKELNDIKAHNEESLAKILKKIEDSGPLNEKIATELSLKIDAVEGMISKLNVTVPKPTATKTAASKGDEIEKFAKAEFTKNAEAWKVRYNIPPEIIAEIKNIEITKKNSTSATKMEAVFNYIYNNISSDIKDKIVEDYKRDKETSLDVINAPDVEDDESSVQVPAPVVVAKVTGKGKGKGKAAPVVEVIPEPEEEEEAEEEAPVVVAPKVTGKGKGKGKAAPVVEVVEEAPAPVVVPKVTGKGKGKGKAALVVESSIPVPEPEEEEVEEEAEAEAEDDGIEFVIETPVVAKGKGKGKGKK
jgi:hypothetical protein